MVRLLDLAEDLSSHLVEYRLRNPAYRPRLRHREQRAEQNEGEIADSQRRDRQILHQPGQRVLRRRPGETVDDGRRRERLHKLREIYHQHEKRAEQHFPGVGLHHRRETQKVRALVEVSELRADVRRVLRRLPVRLAEHPLLFVVHLFDFIFRAHLSSSPPAVSSCFFHAAA